MTLSKDELKKKVGELVEDNDKAIELLEYIEDSIDTKAEEDLQNKLNETQAKLEDITEKYKQRFLEVGTKDTKETKEDITELKEESIIDIKEI